MYKIIAATLLGIGLQGFAFAGPSVPEIDPASAAKRFGIDRLAQIVVMVVEDADSLSDWRRLASFGSGP